MNTSISQRITKEQLEALKNRTATAKSIAEQLGVSETYFSKVFSGTIDKVPAPTVVRKQQAHVLRQVRTEMYTALAADVKAGRRSAQSAARLGNCSVRTIYRYAA